MKNVYKICTSFSYISICLPMRNKLPFSYKHARLCHHQAIVTSLVKYAQRDPLSGNKKHRFCCEFLLPGDGCQGSAWVAWWLHIWPGPFMCVRCHGIVGRMFGDDSFHLGSMWEQLNCETFYFNFLYLYKKYLLEM